MVAFGRTGKGGAMIYLSNRERCEYNRDRLMAWADEGRSYFWMAKEIGINDRNAAIVSQWFIKQGIRRKAAR